MKPNRTMTKGQRLLGSLIKKATANKEHPWKQYADLIYDCDGIADASILGFTVQFPDGSRQIEFEGGLTEEHFSYFAPLLDEWDKAALAVGVLRNKLRHQSHFRWSTAWAMLRSKYGDQEDQWITQRIVTEGFDAIAHELKEAAIQYQKDHPSPRLETWTFEKPKFDRNSGTLFWGQSNWRFRKQPGAPVWELLCEFEAKGWPCSVKLDDLTPEQVHEARRVLHNKTMATIDWHESGDRLTWSLPKRSGSNS